jgi:hypothetical protein
MHFYYSRDNVAESRTEYGICLHRLMAGRVSPTKRRDSVFLGA